MTSSSSATHDWTTHVLLTKIPTFPESPETYRGWKQTILNTVREFYLSEKEQLYLIMKWLGQQSKRQAISLRQANPGKPQTAINCIWKRMSERYGAPEMVDHSLKKNS